MEISNVDFIIGSATVLMLAIGYIMGVRTLFIYKAKRKKLILLTSFLFFALPSPWLDFGLRFLLALSSNTIDHTISVFLFAWAIPVLVIIWGYITSSLYQNHPWVKNAFLVLSAIPGLVFIISIYIFRDFTVEEIPGSVGVSHIFSAYQNMIILFFGALGIVFVLPTYLYFSIKSNNKLFKFKTRMIALSVFLFSTVGVLDGIVTFGMLAEMLFLRFFLVLSLVFLYLGYNTPKFIEARY